MSLERFNEWNEQNEKLLYGWKDQIEERKDEHYKESIKYSRRHYLVGIPSTILSSISASGFLATFKNCDSDSCSNDEWIRLLFAIIGLISVILSALITFMDYGRLSEKHKTSSDSYEDLLRNIEVTLKISKERRPDASLFLRELQYKLGEVVKDSPPIKLKHIIHVMDLEKPGDSSAYTSLKEANMFELGRLNSF